MVDTIHPANAVTGAPSYSGRMLRQVGSAMKAGATAARPLGGRSGVRPGTDPATVTATSSVWTCKPFAGVADAQTAAEAGPYEFAFDANATGAVTAAHATLARTDIIQVRVDDPAESDGSSVPVAVRTYKAGTAGSGVAATPDARCFVVANINVPASGGGSPTVTWVAPYAVAAGAILPVLTRAALPASGDYIGMYADVFADSTVGLNGLYRWSGTSWLAAGFACRMARTATTPTVSAATFTDLSANANWSTAQNIGFAAYANGIIIPVTGWYRVTYSLAEQSNIALLTGVTINKSAGVAFVDYKVPDSAAAVQSVVAPNASGEVFCTAADVLRLFALAASGTPALLASMGEFTVEWVRAG